MKEGAQNYYRKKLERLADHELRSISRRAAPPIETIGHVHLIGVCGTAMGSLAGLLKKAGHSVSGSDEHCYPPMSDEIAEIGVDFREGFKAENLKGADLIVVGNVCGPNNPEATYARENNLPTVSLAEAVALFFLGPTKKSLVVAGTHGKTTTTGLLAHVFSAAGADPTYLVGGVMQNYHRSFHLGKGEFAILEGDEYDTAYFDKGPKFLHYQPHGVIITSLEFDHIDIYSDMTDYTAAFKFLVEEIPEGGHLLLWGDDQNVRELAKEAKCNVYFYGLKGDNQITAQSIKVTAGEQKFNLVLNGKELGEISTTLHGKHNLLNSLAVCGLSIANGLSFEKIKDGMATFKGMKRRQEIIGEMRGISIIDDFAHHPTAVRETISAIREKFPNRRLVCFFEPRSNTSRRKLFEEDYGRAFDAADKVYLSVPPLRHNDTREDFIDEEKVTDAINERGQDDTKAKYFPKADALLESATPEFKEGDVVLIMSNGSFDGIHQKLLARLS